MWPFEKKIKCENCGYLTDEGSLRVSCFRQREMQNFMNVEFLPRICKLYHKKVAGLTPEQLLEHQLYKGPGVSLSRWALFWSIVAIFLSAGALIVSMIKQ